MQHRARVAACVAAVLAPVIAAGCVGTSATQPIAPSHAVLSAAEYSAITGAGLFVRIDSVTEESRCPSNVVCVQAGRAVVRLAAHAGLAPDRFYTVNTTTAPSTVADGYRITLDSLTPYPAGQPISQSSYRAYVTVAFLPDH